MEAVGFSCSTQRSRESAWAAVAALGTHTLHGHWVGADADFSCMRLQIFFFLSFASFIE